MSADFDLMHGGFGHAPKFPVPMLVDALLVKGEAGTLDLAQRTWAMARGGIHDQIGGGFHRYAVDAGWVVPLREDAQRQRAAARRVRARLAADAAARGPAAVPLRAGRARHRRLGRARDDDARGSVRGVPGRRLGRHPRHGPRGHLLRVEPRAAGRRARRGRRLGGRSVPRRKTGTFEHGLSTLQLRGAPDAERLAEVSARLLATRAERFPPPRDGKVVTAWNGWMIENLLWAALVFGERSWIDLAHRAADHLWSVHWTADGLAAVPSTVWGDAPVSRRTTARWPAPSRGSRVCWASRRGSIAPSCCSIQAIERFGAPDGGFYDAADGDLFSRPRDVQDNPTPSGTMALVAALRTTGALADRADFLARADAAARTTWGIVAAAPRFAPAALADLAHRGRGPQGAASAVAVVLDEDADPLNDAARAVWRMAPAGTVVVSGRPGTSGFAHHFDNRTTIDVPAARIAATGAVEGITTSTRSSRWITPCTCVAARCASRPRGPSRTSGARCGAAPERTPTHPAAGASVSERRTGEVR